MFKIDFNKINIIVKKCSLLILAQATMVILGMITSIIIARHLSLSNFGSLSFAQSITGILYVFSDFGFSTLAIRELSRNKYNTKKYIIYTSLFKILISTFLFVFLYFYFIIFNYEYDTIYISFIFLLSAIISSFSNLFRSAYKSQDVIKYELFLILYGGIFRTLLIYYFVQLEYGLYHITYAYLFIEASIFFISIFIGRKMIYNIKELSNIYFADTIKKAIPFCITSFIGILYLRIDIVMISIMLNSDDIAIYSIACTIIYSFVIVPDSILTVFYPLLSRHYENKYHIKQTINILIKYLYISSFPIILFLLLYSDNILFALFGEKYIASSDVIYILSMYLLIRFINHPLGYTLSSQNREKYRALCASICALSNILLNCIMIRYYGYLGAAYTTVATELLLLILYYYNTKKINICLQLPLYNILAPPIFIILPSIFVRALLGSINILFYIIIGMIYIYLLLKYDVIDEKERNIFFNARE